MCNDSGVSMTLIARASSRHAAQDHGPLRCVGHFRSAINFVTRRQRLLTLHRAGRGLSPMGWEIDCDDFDDIADELAQCCHCELTPSGMVLGDITLCPAERCTDLSLTVVGETAAAPLLAILSKTEAESGLAGRLSQVVTQPPTAEIAQIQRLFAAWLQGKSVDWSSILGKGPGLTPSNDDTVLGLLLCAWFDRRIDVARLPAFFAGSGALNMLTTLVSASYLEFAAQGIFATPLHQFALALSGGGKLSDAVEDMLTLGHSSGADTLLGIWYGTCVINKLI